MKGTVNGSNYADEGVNPGKQFFLTGLMEGINFRQFLPKLPKGEMSMGFK